MTEKIRILLTGATGLVGRAVAERILREEKYELIAVGGRQKAPEFENRRRPAFFQAAEIADYRTLEPLEKQSEIDVVIHAAGLAHQFGPIAREEFFAVNVRGTENICRLAGKIGARQLINLSSVSVYGNHGALAVGEDFACRPIGDYAESKLAAENRAAELCRQTGIALCTLRLGTVIGEEDRGNLSRLITTIDKGWFFWVGKGRNKKTLIYKNDVAESILKIVEADRRETEIFNLTAEAVEMKAVVEAIVFALGKKKPFFYVPENFLRLLFKLNRKIFPLEKIRAAERSLEKWLADDIYAGEKFYAKYAYLPPTPIGEAIARQVRHYLQSKK